MNFLTSQHPTVLRGLHVLVEEEGEPSSDVRRTTTKARRRRAVALPIPTHGPTSTGTGVIMPTPIPIRVHAPEFRVSWAEEANGEFRFPRPPSPLTPSSLASNSRRASPVPSLSPTASTMPSLSSSPSSPSSSSIDLPITPPSSPLRSYHCDSDAIGTCAANPIVVRCKTIRPLVIHKRGRTPSPIPPSCNTSVKFAQDPFVDEWFDDDDDDEELKQYYLQQLDGLFALSPLTSRAPSHSYVSSSSSTRMRPDSIPVPTQRIGQPSERLDPLFPSTSRHMGKQTLPEDVLPSPFEAELPRRSKICLTPLSRSEMSPSATSSASSLKLTSKHSHSSSTDSASSVTSGRSINYSLPLPRNASTSMKTRGRRPPSLILSPTFTSIEIENEADTRRPRPPPRSSLPSDVDFDLWDNYEEPALCSLNLALAKDLPALPAHAQPEVSPTPRQQQLDSRWSSSSLGSLRSSLHSQSHTHTVPSKKWGLFSASAAKSKKAKRNISPAQSMNSPRWSSPMSPRWSGEVMVIGRPASLL